MDRNDKDYLSFLLGIILLPFILGAFDGALLFVFALLAVCGVFFGLGYWFAG